MTLTMTKPSLSLIRISAEDLNFRCMRSSLQETRSWRKFLLTKKEAWAKPVKFSSVLKKSKPQPTPRSSFSTQLEHFLVRAIFVSSSFTETWHQENSLPSTSLKSKDLSREPSAGIRSKLVRLIYARMTLSVKSKLNSSDLSQVVNTSSFHPWTR